MSLFRVFTFWLLSLVSVFAQGGSQEKLHIRFVSIAKLPQEAFHVRGENFTEEVGINSLNFSREIEWAGQGSLYVCQNTQEMKTEEERKANSIADFVPKAANGHLIALLVPESSPSKRYRVVQIPSDANAFPWGARLVFNLSDTPIQIELAGEKTQVPATQSRVVKSPASAKGAFVPVVGVFQSEGAARKFLSSRWLTDSHSRSLVFVYRTPHGKGITFHGIEDTHVVVKRGE